MTKSFWSKQSFFLFNLTNFDYHSPFQVWCSISGWFGINWVAVFQNRFKRYCSWFSFLLLTKCSFVSLFYLVIEGSGVCSCHRVYSQLELVQLLCCICNASKPHLAHLFFFFCNTSQVLETYEGHSLPNVRMWFGMWCTKILSLSLVQCCLIRGPPPPYC